MRQTLFFIPDQLFGMPLFGIGCLLFAWIGGCTVALAYAVRKRGFSNETKGFIPLVLIVAVALAVVLPMVEVEIPPRERHLLLWQSQPTAVSDGEPVSPIRGLPIRGYGIFLLVATVSGVLLATHRAKKVGLAPDVIFSLAFNMFVGGILGARLFYIIQYWNENIYVPSSLPQTLGNMVNFVEGGLVVYGSLVGALTAGMWFLRKHRLPALPIADLIAPSLALGLAIGRIGCLMNGCCYGGNCDQPWAITFPSGSPAYFDQHRSGQFYGFQLGENESGKPYVKSTEPGGPAEAAKLSSGTVIDSIGSRPTRTLLDAQLALDGSRDTVNVTTAGTSHQIVSKLPDRSGPIHPTQIYSAVNAALLCLVTLAWFPFRRRDGEVFALLIGAYAVTRFLLEVIRTDEVGIWNTGMTISQNVSVVMLIGAAALTFYLSRQPRGSFWPAAASL